MKARSEEDWSEKLVTINSISSSDFSGRFSGNFWQLSVVWSSLNVDFVGSHIQLSSTFSPSFLLSCEPFWSLPVYPPAPTASDHTFSRKCSLVDSGIDTNLMSLFYSLGVILAMHYLCRCESGRVAGEVRHLIAPTAPRNLDRTLGETNSSQKTWRVSQAQEVCGR